MAAFRASAAEVDLDPLVGGYMTGFAARVDPAIGVHDANMARAVLLDDGDTLFAIVSCDLIGFSAAAVASMRERIAGAIGHIAESGRDIADTFICCTHTHSGPTSMKMRGVLGYLDEAWLARCQDKIVDLVAGLPERLEPARLAHASATVTGIGHNRQDNSRRIDEELIAISVENTSGQAIATLLNYATHAVVLGPSNLLYSGDHPGASARQIARARGGVGLYLQGSCGDVNPLVRRDAVGEIGTFDDCEAIGAKLTAAAVDALRAAPRVSDVTIRTAQKSVDIPLEPPPTLSEIEEMLAEFQRDREAARSKEPPDRVAELVAVAYTDWANELREMIVSGTVPSAAPAELYVVGINDLRIVGLPFETYTDIGISIKEGLRPLKAAFVGYANGLLGYCPTRWAKEQGGYGAGYGSARWFGELVTPVGYGADDLLISEAITLSSSVSPCASPTTRPG